MGNRKCSDGRPIRLVLTCDGGGHFEQMRNLSSFYNSFPHFWITSLNAQTENALREEKRYYLRSAHFKRPWTYLSQIPICVLIFAKERPTHLISTGSGRIAFIPIVLSLICQTRVIYIETFSHVNSLTKLGRFLARIKHPILSQWRASAKQNIRYIGPIMTGEPPSIPNDKRTDHVFVTLGTRSEPFPRIIQAVETLISQGVIKERVIVQAGHTSYKSDLLELFSFCSPDTIDDLVKRASYVITQESAGIGTKCLRFGTKMIVMPRDYSYGELPAKSDMREDLHLRLGDLGYVFVVHDAEDLRNAVNNLENLRVGFHFDNGQALSMLRKLIESQ